MTMTLQVEAALYPGRSGVRPPSLPLLWLIGWC